MSAPLRLISHKLCPYVQRAVIALTEKGVAFERIDVDLANKPDWFLKISPLGRTPVLQVGDTAIFESAVILEYLEETEPKPLHPADALRRAEHRGWIEFGSAVLNDIAGLYSAADEAAFKAKAAQLEAALRGSRRVSWLRRGSTARSSRWSMRCSVRCFVISMCSTKSATSAFSRDKPKLARWRASLAARPSVKSAVSADYPALLRDFLKRRNSWMSQLQCRLFDVPARQAANSNSGTSNRKAALESIRLPVPMTFQKFVEVDAAMEHELRKVGTEHALPPSPVSEFGGHLGERRNRVHVARGAGLGGGNDEF